MVFDERLKYQKKFRKILKLQKWFCYPILQIHLKKYVLAFQFVNVDVKNITFQIVFPHHSDFVKLLEHQQ